jgi:hypothetical protein
MAWYVHGSEVSFGVDENGLHAFGMGRQDCRPGAVTGVDMGQVSALPAEWTIYRASEAAQAARLLALDTFTMKSELDPAVAEINEAPLTVVRYEADCIGFAIFLPDRYFNDAWELLKILTNGERWRYRFAIDFCGFIPQRSLKNPDLVPYDEWLDGKAYISSGFLFRLLTRGDVEQ